MVQWFMQVFVPPLRELPNQGQIIFTTQSKVLGLVKMVRYIIQIGEVMDILVEEVLQKTQASDAYRLARSLERCSVQRQQ